MLARGREALKGLKVGRFEEPSCRSKLEIDGWWCASAENISGRTWAWGTHTPVVYGQSAEAHERKGVAAIRSCT
jgi:hypothetical protein